MEEAIVVDLIAKKEPLEDKCYFSCILGCFVIDLAKVGQSGEMEEDSN